MEKTTLISGNGFPYEREIPKVMITTSMNEVALENLRVQTGIDFKETFHGNYVGQPETWEQFSKIFLTYNFLTHDVNNWEGNIMYLRGDCNTPSGATLFYRRGGKEYIGVQGID